MLTPKEAKEEYLKQKLEREEERKKNLPNLVEFFLDNLIRYGKFTTDRSDIVDAFLKAGYNASEDNGVYLVKII